MSSVEDTGTVRYTVKELLARMDGKLDHIVEQMHEKVDVAEFRKLGERVDSSEGRIVSLEQDAASSRQLATYKKWLIGVSLTVLGLVVAMVTILANAHYG